MRTAVDQHVLDWFSQNLRIKHRETGGLVPYRARAAQLRLRAAVDRQLDRRGYVRIIILKPRQLGLSTEVQGIGFRMGLEVPHVEGLVVAHEAKSVDAIFRRTKIFESRCPLRRPLKFSNRKEIEWKDPHFSAIRVAVAGSDDVGRGDQRHFLHLSELAFWQESHVESALLSLLNSVQDRPGTIIVIESTANGVGGEFYDRWSAAERGESDFEPLFFSWLEDEEYRLRGVALEDTRKVPDEWMEDEPGLRALGADDEQLAWRRHMIANKCGGSVEKFRQEYPSNPREAFISSGRAVFLPSVCQPALVAAQERERRAPARRYTLGAKGELREDPRGLLRIWEHPNPLTEYLLTADVARGVEVDTIKSDGRKLGDFSTAGVMDRGSKREVAVWHGRLDPDLFGGICAALGRYYKNAWAAVEANHYGVIAIKAMLRAGYPRMFRKERVEITTSRPVEVEHENYMESGWWTSPATKPVMISDLSALLREHAIQVMEPEAWEELLVYERKRDGTLGARHGCYDDRVMRLAIAATIAMNHPWKAEERGVAPIPYTQRWFEMAARERGQQKSGGSFQM